MVFPPLTWVLLIVSAVLCAVGFYRFVYFMTSGYGLAVAGIGVSIGAIAIVNGYTSVAMLLLCVLCLVYGLRLGLFLIIREIKSEAYRKTLASQTQNKVPFFVSIVMWVACACLYVLQVSSVWYRASNYIAGVTDKSEIPAYIGAAIMLIGIIIESVADKQKSAAKLINPNMPAMNGLYKFCRCPNYFGEIVFWTGLVISGVNVITGWQWLIVGLGYITIFAVMMSGAKRLEKRHIKNYGDKEEYRKYADTTPIIFPFIPFYHIVKEEKSE
ncbi:MAG: DUF1295 domain-containing protein [Clostridiales bacterium]|nr:DUF1295 domain-containing protein [Clostridiales bacterium]